MSDEAPQVEVLDAETDAYGGTSGRRGPGEPPDPGKGEAAALVTGAGVAGDMELNGAMFTPSRNFQQAVQIGHVLAASGMFDDAKDPAKAAVKVMFGMDLGVSPTAALAGIHFIEEKGRLVPIIEGKLLASVIKSRQGYDYEVTEYTDEKCTIVFYRDGLKVTPEVSWTAADTQRAGLAGKDNHKKYPRTMNYWRALAEGSRLHFPELWGGSPIYVQEEMPGDVDLRRELAPNTGPVALQDERAEQLRAEARVAFDALKELNPARLVPGRFANMLKGAEHSHEALGNVGDAVRDLLATEPQIIDLKAQVADLETLQPTERKAAIDRAERQGSQRDRIDVLVQTLEAAAKIADGGEGEDPEQAPEAVDDTAPQDDASAGGDPPAEADETGGKA
jgi:hypothetical protein